MIVVEDAFSPLRSVQCFVSARRDEVKHDQVCSLALVPGTPVAARHI